MKNRVYLADLGVDGKVLEKEDGMVRTELT
jgi:hypothetical protein